MRLIKYQPLHFITLWSGYPHTQILTRQHRLGNAKVKMFIEFLVLYILYSLYYLWWVQISTQKVRVISSFLLSNQIVIRRSIKNPWWNTELEFMHHHRYGSSVLSNIYVFAVLAVLQVLGLNQGVLCIILLKSVYCKPIQGSSRETLFSL